jgi:hypothetical protein
MTIENITVINRGPLAPVGPVQPPPPIDVPSLVPIDDWISYYQPLNDDLTALSNLNQTNVIYYRSDNAAWSPVTIGIGLAFNGGNLEATGGGGGGGIPEAPSDGKAYGRQNVTWVQVAPINSPNFTGTPTAPTNPAPSDASTQIATTAWVHSAISSVSSGVTNVTVQDGLSGGGSGAVTIGVNQIGVPKGGTGAATLTGYVMGNGAAAMTASPTIPNTAINGLGTMSTQNASAVAITGGTVNNATLNTPVLTGTPTAPTPPSADNSTKVATTAFVLQNAVAGSPGPPGPAGPGYEATSADTVAIGTGPVTVSTQAGLAYTVGARARIAYQTDPTQWMEGLVTAYSGTALTVNVDLTSAAVSAAALILPNHLSGLTLANDATTPVTVLDVGPGAAASDDNSAMMVLSAAGFKKNCNAAWAAGSGNGALDTGTALAANTWYHVFLIERPDTLVVGVLISTSATAPTLPTNYTRKRRIGSIKTDASAHILAFTQLGDDFLWTVPVTDANNISASTTVSLLTLSLPAGIKTVGYFTADFAPAAGNAVVFQSPDQPLGGYFVPAGNASLYGPGGIAGCGDFKIRTNTSSQISYVASASVTGLYIVTKGWTDNRGK